MLDHFVREAKAAAGIDSLTASSYVLRSTVKQELQRAAEAALQEVLARYELNTGRMRFEGAEANLSEAIQRLAGKAGPDEPRPGKSGADQEPSTARTTGLSAPPISGSVVVPIRLTRRPTAPDPARWPASGTI